MSEEEACELEKDTRWETVIRFRNYDEAGKVHGMELPSVDSFMGEIKRIIIHGQDEGGRQAQPSIFARSYVLSTEQLRRLGSCRVPGWKSKT